MAQATKKAKKTVKAAVPAVAKQAKSQSAAKPAIAALNTWHKWLTAIYALQGVAILVLSTAKTFPVTLSYTTQNPIASETAGHAVFSTATRHVFELHLSYVVGAFLLVLAVAQFIVATVCRKRYEQALQQGVSTIRWIATGISTGLMLVAVGMLSGVTDLTALIMIFTLELLMGLVVLGAEVYRQKQAQPVRLSCVAVCIAAAVPLATVLLYAIAAHLYGGHVPGFLYRIYATLIIGFGAAGVLLFLQHKRQGRWSESAYSERALLLLTVAIQTLLAWQIFAGALRP